jgi:hypothetical protein
MPNEAALVFAVAYKKYLLLYNFSLFVICALSLRAIFLFALRRPRYVYPYSTGNTTGTIPGGLEDESTPAFSTLLKTAKRAHQNNLTCYQVYLYQEVTTLHE